jgi:hypothetical protein
MKSQCNAVKIIIIIIIIIIVIFTPLVMTTE